MNGETKDFDNRLVGHIVLRAEVGEKEHVILKAMDDYAWNVSEIKVLENREVQISLAYGRTVYKGKIVAPATADFLTNLVINEANASPANDITSVDAVL